MTGLVLSFIGAVIAMSIGLVPIVAGQRQKGRTNFREWRRAAQIGAALVISGAIVAMLAVVGSARS